MSKLYIISDTVDHGSSTANMVLSLSTGQFKVITSLNDLDIVPDGAVFVDDKYHPNDSVKMGELLSQRGCIDCNDIQNLVRYLDKFIDEFINTARYYVDFISMGPNQRYIDLGYDNLKNLSRKYFPHFNIDPIYSYKSFSIRAADERSQVICNLISGRILSRENENREATIERNKLLKGERELHDYKLR